MPTYRIKSGEMDHKLKTPYDADAMTLACLAVEACKPEKPGQLVEVGGGQYKRGGVTYLSFETVAQRIGRMPA